MGEDEGMGANEGKDLALAEKIKYAIETAPKDEHGNTVDYIAIDFPGSKYPLALGVKFDETGKKREIYLLGEQKGVHILTLDENNELSFVPGWEDNLRNSLMRNRNEFLFDPNILVEELKRMKGELEAKKETRQRESTKRAGVGEEKDEEEKGKQEKPKLKEDDKTKEEIARKYNVSARKVVHLANDERVTKDKTFERLVEWAKEYDDVYIVSGEPNEYSSKFIGVKDGKQVEIEEQEKKRTGGTNPSHITINLNRGYGKEIEAVHPIDMYEIDNEHSIAIIRGTQGTREAVFCRQVGGDEHKFAGVVIPEAERKNIRQTDSDTRDSIDDRTTSDLDLIQNTDNLSYLEELKNRGLPVEAKTEMTDGDRDRIRDNIKEEITLKLIAEDKMLNRLTSSYDAYRYKAEQILKALEENKGKTYEEVKKEIERQNQDSRENSHDEDADGPWASRRPR